MGARNDPYSDYDETTGVETDTYEDEPGDSAYAEESATWTWGWGLLPLYSGDRAAADRNEAFRDDAYYADDDDTWADEALVSTLLIVGVVLFVVPEPITTTLGILLIIAGVAVWLIEELV